MKLHRREGQTVAKVTFSVFQAIMEKGTNHTIQIHLPMVIHLKWPKTTRKDCKCKLELCCPSQLALKIMDKVYSDDKKPTSPFAYPPPQEADLLETENLISLIATTAISREEIQFLDEHQALSPSNKDKFHQNVRAVTQAIDNASVCSDKSHRSNCKCFLTLKAFIEITWLLEEYALLVTNGDWKTPLQKLLTDTLTTKQS